MLFVVPIESYDSRYTEQWNRWFPSYLRRAGIPFAVVEGSSSVAPVDRQEVLDPYGTHLFKFKQLYRLVQMIRDGAIGDGDVLLFHTLWFTGIDALQYLRDLTHRTFKITGVLHAGAYDPWDFRARYGMTSWAHPLECAWLSFVDRIFVATDFHRRLLLAGVPVDPRKVFVTGLPLLRSEITAGREGQQRERRIIFPHRDVPEKAPEIVGRLRRIFGDSTVVRTRDVCDSKAQYYDLLATSRVCVSDSYQETFGYAMLEAGALGCIPVVPRRLCYPEMYPEPFLFETEDELIARVRRALDAWVDPRTELAELFAWTDGALERIVHLALECAGSV